MKKRAFLQTAAALAALVTLGQAQAQTAIKFQLDWRFEGPAALFTVPAKKGYFKDEKLDVTIDAGNGSGGTVTRVATGTYDMGFADMAALMEFWGNNPDRAEQAGGGDDGLQQHAGRRAGAEEVRHPANRPTWSARSSVRRCSTPGARRSRSSPKANGLDLASGLDGDGPAAARDHAGARRHRCDHRLLLHVAAQPERPRREGRGHRDPAVPAVRREAVRQRDHRQPEASQENPEAVKAFLRAFTKGVKDVMADPDRGIERARARRLIDVALETRRLQAGAGRQVVTPTRRPKASARSSGPRLALMASQVNDAFGLKERISPTDLRHRPAAAEGQRNIFVK
jgi:NitT/TauT family transport system substrate-binding protein